MKKLIVAAGFAAALALPAYAQTAKPKVAQKAPSTSEFVQKAAITNMFEIQAGQIAQNKSTDPKVDSYAKMIVQDHQQAQDQLKSKVQGINNVKMPAQLDSDHQKKISQLKSASGAKFLRTFKTQQVQGHQQGIKMFQAYAQNGDNATLKQWAQQTVPVLQKHLQHAQELPTSAKNAPTVGAGSNQK